MDDARASLHKDPLYAQVADLLEQEIIADAPERLPSEQMLAERFDVSRTIVREALKLLRERGLIDSRTGSGAYVTKPEAHNLSDVMGRIIRVNGIDVRSIYEVREILEVAAIRRAAVCATPGELNAMRAILADLQDRTMGVTERRDRDFGFHLAIAQASRNPLLALLVETMRNVFKDIITSGIYVQGGIDDAIVRHGKIMRAIESGDPDASERAMVEHLRQSLENAIVYQRRLGETAR